MARSSNGATIELSEGEVPTLHTEFPSSVLVSTLKIIGASDSSVKGCS